MSKIKIHGHDGARELNLGGLLTASDVDTQNMTLTVAHIVGGVLVHTSTSGGGTITVDTGVNIIAGYNGAGRLIANGDTEICYFINDGSQTDTFAVATGLTIADTGQTVATEESCILVFRRLTATTVHMYTIGA